MTGTRTDTATRLIRSDRLRLWQAWFDPAELVCWLPPGGMTGRILAFDPRPGGAFRMVLTYPPDLAGPGKTTADTDEVEGRFTAIERPDRVEMDVIFRSDDPRFAGVMRMQWRFDPEGDATRVTVTCRDVPPGIAPGDHVEGLGATLAQLATQVEPASTQPFRTSDAGLSSV